MLNTSSGITFMIVRANLACNILTKQGKGLQRCVFVIKQYEIIHAVHLFTLVDLSLDQG